MANKTKPAAKQTKAAPAESSITRIKASDTAPKKVKADKKTTKVAKTAKPAKERRGLLKFLASIGGYFKGAWYELRQVRWPNRRATWSLTAAVLIFTTFFVLLVVLLDILFKYLFQLILG